MAAQQHQPTLNPTWYLAWVRQVTAFAQRPTTGRGKFVNGQQVYFWPMGDDKWMLFDGEALYALLETEDAKAALKSCRDGRGKPRLAENQEVLTERFYQTMLSQGGGFACRPRY